MSRRPTRRPPRAAPRRGLAPLEFAMVLPTLLALAMLAQWVALWGAAQVRTVAEARRAAYHQRYAQTAAGEWTTEPGEPLLFPLPGSEPEFLAEEKTEPVRYAALFDSFPPARSVQPVLGGAWDHRELPLDSPPHLTQIPAVIAQGPLGEGLATFNAGDQARQILTQLATDVGKAALKAVVDKIVEQAVDYAVEQAALKLVPARYQNTFKASVNLLRKVL